MQTSVEINGGVERANAGRPNAATRTVWVDHARGAGIVLVVVGHVLGGLQAAGILAGSSEASVAIAWIYAFHMPLFFFLAGLFAVRSAQAAFPAYLAARLRTLAYPYFLWSVLQTLLQSGLAPVTNHGISPADLLRLLDTPIAQFWFLYVLFFISMLFWAARRAGLGSVTFLCLAAGLYLAATAGNIGSWGPAYGIARHLPYFALGVVVAPRLFAALPQASHRWRFAVAGGAFALLTVAVGLGTPRSLWLAPFVAALGVAGAVALAAGTADSPRWRFVGILGERSLPIYLAHTIAAAGCRIVLQRAAGVDDALVHVVAGTLAGLLGPLALVWFCDRVGFHYAFAWPAGRGAGEARATTPAAVLPAVPMRS